MMFSSRLVLTFAAMFACQSHAVDSTPEGRVTVTSLVRLLGQPEQYDGKWVQVEGYYTTGFEDYALFLTKEAAERRDLASCVWVRPPDARTDKILRDGFVRVIGV